MSVLEILMVLAFTTVALALLISFIQNLVHGRRVLTTQAYSLSSGYRHMFVYRHSLLSNKTMFLTVKPEEDDNDSVYVLEKTTYYNGREDIFVSIISHGMPVYTAHLKNIIHEDKKSIEEGVE